MDWMTWLQDWGDAFYPLAFIWAFFEGETFVIFGGMGAHLGIINLYWLVAAVWIGSFMGDQCYFWIGRKWGAKALARFPAAEARASRVLYWLETYGVGFILAFRFLYGVRNIASVAVGTSRMPWRKFLFWNFIAAGIWAWSFAGAGYLFGEAAAAIGENGPKILLLIALGIGLTLFAVKSVMWVRRRYAASETQA
ncbi:DedA [Azospirillum argentinense]